MLIEIEFIIAICICCIFGINSQNMACRLFDFNNATSTLEFEICENSSQFTLGLYANVTIQPFRSDSTYHLTNFAPGISCFRSTRLFNLDEYTEINSAIYLNSIDETVYVEILAIQGDVEVVVGDAVVSSNEWYWFDRQVTTATMPNGQIEIRAFTTSDTLLAIEYMHILNPRKPEMYCRRTITTTTSQPTTASTTTTTTTSTTTETQTEPTEIETESTETETQPTESDTESTQTETVPSVSETAPTETETETTETETETTEMVPSETEAQPTETDTESTETNTEPTEYDTEPTETDAEPTETDAEPTETDAEPTETDAEPTETDTEPTEADTEPTEADTEEPTETDTEPTETYTEPTEADTEPTEADTEPTETNTEPMETDTEPTETDTAPTVTETKPTETEAMSTVTDTEPMETVTETTVTQTLAPSEPPSNPNNSNDGKVWNILSFMFLSTTFMLVAALMYVLYLYKTAAFMKKNLLMASAMKSTTTSLPRLTVAKTVNGDQVIVGIGKGLQ